MVDGEGEHFDEEGEGDHPGEQFDEDEKVIILESSSTESHLKAMAMMARESILTRMAKVIIRRPVRGRVT